MARTSAKAKKQKQDVSSSKTENKSQSENVSKEEEHSNDSTDKENDSSNFEVEKIIHTRVFHGKRQFLVRWKGYKEDSDTWENESNLQTCTDELERFKKDNPSLNEKSKFESDNEAEDEKTESEEDEEKEKKRAKKEKVTSAKKGKKGGKTPNTKKSKQVVQASTESEEEDDVPLVNYESEGEMKGKKRGHSENKEVPISVKKSKPESGGKEAKKVKSSEKEDDAESDAESVTDGTNYEVEKILEVHTRKDGSREFLIRWKGYRPSDDTWEPEAHLDCQELIEKFMEKVDKAKRIPARELREARKPTERYIPNNKARGLRANLRNTGVRHSYTE